MLENWTVPPIWDGETAYILCAGPSLDLIDLERLRNHNVICVNFTYLKASWAPVLYGSDPHFWRFVSDDFAGIKVSACNPQQLGVKPLRNAGPVGLELDPTGVRLGWTSTYAAINLAFHFGVKTIVLLGADMRMIDGKSHFVGYPHIPKMICNPELPGDRERYFGTYILPGFDVLAGEIAEQDVEVINATPGSALQAFAIAEPDSVLPTY